MVLTLRQQQIAIVAISVLFSLLVLVGLVFVSLYPIGYALSSASNVIYLRS